MENTFTINNLENIFKFKIYGDISEIKMKEFLGILSKLLDRKIKFCIIVDCTEMKYPPLKLASNLVVWLKKNKLIISEYLLASAVIISPKYPKLRTVINWVFDIQKPSSPNIITIDENHANDFINKYNRQ